jgi:general transcription factor 3C polypeptide 5 (transcription factor C subunit 1)
VTFAKDGTGSGEVQIVAPQRRIPVNNIIISVDAERVPFETNLPAIPEDELSEDHRDFIDMVREQFERRPILTRHVLYNVLGWQNRDKIRLAISYVAYQFSSGPWKNALIKLGLDPRTDPKYRHYQTLMFQRFRNEEFKHWRYLTTEMSPEALEIIQKGHIFDGKSFAQTGHVFQVCDFTDPILRFILDTNDIRHTCSVRKPSRCGYTYMLIVY